MSLGPAVLAIKAKSAPFTAWPLRWQNEAFADSVAVDQGGKPIAEDGTPLPYVIGEVIGGKNRTHTFGSPGNRLEIHPGLIRFYLCVPAGTGTDDAYIQADAIGTLFELTEFAGTGGTVRSYEPSTNDGAAGFEDGSYFVLTVSVTFDWLYRT